MNIMVGDDHAYEFVRRLIPVVDGSRHYNPVRFRGGYRVRPEKPTRVIIVLVCASFTIRGGTQRWWRPGDAGVSYLCALLHASPGVVSRGD